MQKVKDKKQEIGEIENSKTDASLNLLVIFSKKKF